ncbi:MAG TPA: hypothetical protein VLA56_03780 [Pseudomonadales bacterium]|nr:hypothetical protein [Pseudomonadales bacterium]
MTGPTAAGVAARGPSAPGFVPGAALGAGLAAAGLLLSGQPLAAGDWSAWIIANLGHSVWVFAVVLVLWAANLERLHHRLARPGEAHATDARSVAALDQLSDVWIHLFVGIGVIWTAIGMRGALQVTLGDPDATLSDGAGSVLRGLVDGGILLALTTTIVGGIGGYLMRLAKTLWVGPALHAHYDAEQVRELRELIETTRRIESSLARGQGANDAPAA